MLRQMEVVLCFFFFWESEEIIMYSVYRIINKIVNVLPSIAFLS